MENPSLPTLVASFYEASFEDLLADAITFEEQEELKTCLLDEEM